MSSFASPKVWEEPTEVTHEGANALDRNFGSKKTRRFSTGFRPKISFKMSFFANSGCRTSKRKPSRCCHWSGKTALGGIQLIQ